MVELTRKEAESLIREVTKDLRHDECRTCGCFQGFLTQIEIDTPEDVSDLTAPWKVDRSDMHGCLGCDPCPPGKAYADYKRSQSVK